MTFVMLGSVGNSTISFPFGVSKFVCIIYESKFSTTASNYYKVCIPYCIALSSSLSIKSNVSIVEPSPRILSKTTSEFVFFISGYLPAAIERKSSSEYKRQQIPSDVLPALPFRQTAQACDMNSVFVLVIFLSGSQFDSFAYPESITTETLSIVILLSAILVANIIFVIYLEDCSLKCS